MAKVTLSDDIVDGLRLVNMFDPDAAFDYGTSTRTSLVSDDGYRLSLAGRDFAYTSSNTPVDGLITDIFLYDPSGDLVARYDNLSYSLEDYYDTVVIDGRPDLFVADLLRGRDSIAGGLADDKLAGYGGDDVIRGDAGDDVIDGGSGNDSLSGGTGRDTIYGDLGNDRIYGGDGSDKLYGEAGNDTIDAGFGADILEGGSGNDRLLGGADNDYIGGGAGNDRLEGGSGNDRLFGDEGADVLIGGSGRDQLTGGSGVDAFRWYSAAEGGDRVLDFTRGVDLLQFAADGFANLTEDFDLVVGPGADPVSRNASFLFDTTNHGLYYDADGYGSGGERFIAYLDGVSTLSRGDFDIA